MAMLAHQMAARILWVCVVGARCCGLGQAARHRRHCGHLGQAFARGVSHTSDRVDGRVEWMCARLLLFDSDVLRVLSARNILDIGLLVREA